MTKPSPVPDEVSKPFWDACNEHKLKVQQCTACNRLQHPPEAACKQCGSKEKLGWKEMSGKGTIHGYCVSYDSRVMMLQEIQPFNLAVISLDDAPEILMLSHLPGSATHDVPTAGKVEVVFEPTYNGQLIAEWQVIK